MSYEAQETKEYSHPAEAMLESIGAVVKALGAKPAKKKTQPGVVEVVFNKKIRNTPVGNRCQLDINVAPGEAETCTVSAEAYPVDPIGRKLTFGVRGDVARQALDAFFIELESRLGK